MTTAFSFLSHLSACNNYSSFVKLQLLKEADCRVEAILLLMLSLVNSGSSLWRARTDSTLDTISSVSICFGVAESLIPWQSTCVSFSSKGREEIFLNQFLLVLWRFLCAACWSRVSFDCTMAWCCSVVLLAHLSAIVVRVSSKGEGISSLSLLRHNNNLSLV